MPGKTNAVYAAFLTAAGLATPLLATAGQPRAPQLTTLYHFTQSKNGEGLSDGTMTLLGGALYGTTTEGGSAGMGTIFRFDLTTLAESTVFNFTGSAGPGAGPFGPLSHGAASIFGSAYEGPGTGPGSNGNYKGYGTIWRFDTLTGATTVYHGFDGTDGSQPYSGITRANGVSYGTAWYGGPNNSGTVFEIRAGGKLKQLYTFPNSHIGCNPLDAPIRVGHILYGTTSFCGGGGAGTVFSFDLDTKHAALLHSFPANPNGTAAPNGLVYLNGALYGTTFDDGGAGSVYKIDLQTNQYALLHQFSGGADGHAPSSTLAVFQGKLYGVTEYGGATDHGAIYSVDPANGAETTIYSFTGGSDGDTPFAGLLASKSALYGTTLNIDGEYPAPRGSLFEFVP